MAVAYTVATVGSGQSSSPTLSHTPAGQDRLLLYAVAAVSIIGGDAIPDVPTFGGVPLTQVGATQYAGSTSLSVWRKIAPAAATGNIVATYAGLTVNYVCVGVTYSGVHQTVPLGTPQQTASSGTEIAGVLAGTVDGGMIFDAAGIDLVTLTTTASIHGGQTERQNANTGASGFRLRLVASDDLAGGSGDMAWTLAASRAWAHSIVELLAAPSGRVEGRSGLAALKRLARMSFS